MKARPGELELAEARVFWSTLSASSMVREAIAKERAVPDPLDCGILSNEYAEPHYSLATTLTLYISTLIAFFIGFSVAWAVFHGR